MQPRISYITLGVADLGRATRFYCDWLSLSPVKSPVDVSFFDVGEIRLALYDRSRLADAAGLSPVGSGFSGVSLSLNVGAMAEVDRLLREAHAAGGRITRPAGQTAWGGYAGYLADPDGFVWEVVWNPRRSSTVPQRAVRA